MASKKITANYLAQITSLSPATISRYFNSPELLKESTIQYIESTIINNALPFQIYKKRKSQDLVIVNVPSILNSFYGEVIEGIISFSEAKGYKVLIDKSVLNDQDIDSFCSTIKKVGAVGVISLGHLSDYILSVLCNIVPTVQCCEHKRNSKYPYVSVDDYLAAEEAVKYLVALGRKNIALLNGPKTYKFAIEREAAYLDVMQRYGVSAPSSWNISVSEINYDMAYASVCQLLSTEYKPNAFFCVSDQFAAAAIRASQKYSYRVPQDIMVIGFDNIDLSRMFWPTITTVSQPKRQLGYTACEILFQWIQTPEVLPKSIFLNTEIIMRESTNVSQINTIK